MVVSCHRAKHRAGLVDSAREHEVMNGIEPSVDAGDQITGVAGPGRIECAGSLVAGAPVRLRSGLAGKSVNHCSGDFLSVRCRCLQLDGRDLALQCRDTLIR